MENAQLKHSDESKYDRNIIQKINRVHQIKLRET